MTYLTRPVFEFPVNWAPGINRSFTLDLRQVALGFGAEIFTSRQQYVVNGWRLQLELESEADIDAVDTFFDALTGRLQGFWLPVPMEAAQISAGVSSTQFDIVGQNLISTWSDSPDIHLYFSGRGMTAQAAKITAVTDNGNGTERVTVTPAMSPAASTEYQLFRLHYVRLADDVERAVILREGYQQREVRVVELPQEYTTAETGESPIYLYHFWAAAPIDYHWRYTSFASEVISGNDRHTAAAITHGSLKRSVSMDIATVDIVAGYLTDHPLTLFLPFPPGRPINVVISQASLADPDTVKVLFNGVVRKVDDYGTSLTARCDNFFAALKKRIPAMLIKKQCDYQLFDVRTCKAPEALYRTSGFITAIDNDAMPPEVELSLRFPTGDRLNPNYFEQGHLETGIQLDFEVRTIFSSLWSVGTSRMTLKTNGPLLRAIVGQEIGIIPGCDGEKTTCIAKFNNLDNFPGFTEVPANNPSLQAIEARTSAGDKK